MEISKKRHLAKTFTWRLTATLTTMVIAWLVSGDPLTGLTVGGIEFFVKMPIYYFHERVWFKSNFGLEPGILFVVQFFLSLYSVSLPSSLKIGILVFNK